MHAISMYIMITSRSVLLRIRNVSDRMCRENQNAPFVLNDAVSNIVPFMRKNIEECHIDRQETAIEHTRCTKLQGS